jgi:hypothetical protein
MSDTKTYYIEVKASQFTGDDIADYIENGPLYRDDEGTAEDATCEIAALRAENQRLRRIETAAREALAVLTRLADAGLPVPLGSEIDEAKARLAAVLP